MALPQVPVPYWDGSKWVLLDCSKPVANNAFEFFNNKPIIPWPEGFDVSKIKKPKLNIGDTVSFRFGNERPQGKILEIHRYSGEYDPNKETLLEVANNRYLDDTYVWYHVSSEGKTYMVDEGNLVIFEFKI